MEQWYWLFDCIVSHSVTPQWKLEFISENGPLPLFNSPMSPLLSSAELFDLCLDLSPQFSFRGRYSFQTKVVALYLTSLCRGPFLFFFCLQWPQCVLTQLSGSFSVIHFFVLYIIRSFWKIDCTVNLIVITLPHLLPRCQDDLMFIRHPLQHSFGHCIVRLLFTLMVSCF